MRPLRCWNRQDYAAYHLPNAIGSTDFAYILPILTAFTAPVRTESPFIAGKFTATLLLSELYEQRSPELALRFCSLPEAVAQ
jgi:hypothetical protein